VGKADARSAGLLLLSLPFAVIALSARGTPGFSFRWNGPGFI